MKPTALSYAAPNNLCNYKTLGVLRFNLYVELRYFQLLETAHLVHEILYIARLLKIRDNTTCKRQNSETLDTFDTPTLHST